MLIRIGPYRAASTSNSFARSIGSLVRSQPRPPSIPAIIHSRESRLRTAPAGGIEDVPVDGFDQAMALLVRSVMLGMKHAAPIMKRQRSGAIINNGSIAAHLAGYSSSMIYSAAKAA